MHSVPVSALFPICNERSEKSFVSCMLLITKSKSEACSGQKKKKKRNAINLQIKKTNKQPELRHENKENRNKSLSKLREIVLWCSGDTRPHVCCHSFIKAVRIVQRRISRGQCSHIKVHHASRIKATYESRTAELRIAG